MKTLFALVSLAIVSGLNAPAEAVALHYEITNTSGHWMEFKAESDQSHGEKATGHIHAGGAQSGNWELGSSSQNIWFWWDTLYGGAHLKVEIDGKTVFDADCHNGGTGEVRPTDTITSGSATTIGSPKIENGPDRHVNYVRW